MNSTEADRDVIRNLDDLYVGMLTEDELESLDRCIKDGFAEAVYTSLGGLLLGLSKVKWYGV